MSSPSFLSNFHRMQLVFSPLNFRKVKMVDRMERSDKNKKSFYEVLLIMLFSYRYVFRRKNEPKADFKTPFSKQVEQKY